MMSFLTTFINAITLPVRQLYGVVTRWLPGTAWLSNLSLPWKWALTSVVFLSLIWLAAVVNLLFFATHSIGREWLLYIAVGSPALVIIPYLVYQFVCYWLMKEESPFPDIDRVWHEALDLCNQHSILLDETPIFLVIGNGDGKDAVHLSRGDGITKVLQAPESREGPLAVQAISIRDTQPGLFIFLHGCSQISRLGRAQSITEPTFSQSAFSRQDSVAFEPSRTADISVLTGGGMLPRGTQVDVPTSNPFETEGGTMLLGDGQSVQDYLGKPPRKARQLTSAEITDCEHRLRYFCRLLKEVRGALCPYNGLLSLLPVDLLDTSHNALQLAAQRDLAILREELELRVPNIVLVTGMEREDGFLELMKGMPKGHVAESRFGKGSDLWFLPESSRLEAIGSHASGQFEDWIYLMFQSNDALKRRGNSKLFQLLCKIRGGLDSKISSVLGGGFGFQTTLTPNLASEQFLFSGCYFAATGAGESEKGFVKDILKKLFDHEAEIEWTPEALRRDKAYHFLANIAALVGLLALLSIALMLLIKFGGFRGEIG